MSLTVLVSVGVAVGAGPVGCASWLTRGGRVECSLHLHVILWFVHRDVLAGHNKTLFVQPAGPGYPHAQSCPPVNPGPLSQVPAGSCVSGVLGEGNTVFEVVMSECCSVIEFRKGACTGRGFCGTPSFSWRFSTVFCGG